MYMQITKITYYGDSLASHQTLSLFRLLQTVDIREFIQCPEVDTVKYWSASWHA